MPKSVGQVVAVYQNAVNKYSQGEFKYSTDQATAVSYTHLDVYKRQA